MRRDKKRGGNQTQKTRCKHGENYDISRKNVLNVAVAAGCGGMWRDAAGCGGMRWVRVVFTSIYYSNIYIIAIYIYIYILLSKQF